MKKPSGIEFYIPTYPHACVHINMYTHTLPLRQTNPANVHHVPFARVSSRQLHKSHFHIKRVHQWETLKAAAGTQNQVMLPNLFSDAFRF